MVFHLVIQRAGMHSETTIHRWMNAVPLLRVELQQQYNGTLKTRYSQACEKLKLFSRLNKSPLPKPFQRVQFNCNIAKDIH